LGDAGETLKDGTTLIAPLKLHPNQHLPSVAAQMEQPSDYEELASSEGEAFEDDEKDDPNFDVHEECKRQQSIVRIV
jgi:hypothetical protein